MRNLPRMSALGVLALCSAVPAAAQEVVVTGSRMPGYAAAAPPPPYQQQSFMPVVMMRRTADFAVQQVRIVGDTRDQDKRREEVYAMVKNAILAADKAGVELSTGTLVLEPLTLENYKNLVLSNAGRTDTDQAVFFVKTRLSPGIDAKAALARIGKFIAAVPTVGRAEMGAISQLDLSVVDPNQYRGEIIDLIAADAAKTVGKFGPGYAVQTSGLDRPVQWSRAGLIDVYLYLPASYTVVPKP